MSDLATPQIQTVPAPTSPSRASRNLALLIVAIACFVAFGDVVRHEFVDWDDVPNLVVNDGYRGLGVEQLRWMFTTVHGGHFHPLTWLSFAVDHSIWGLSAAGFHLTNLLLHVLTAVGLFGIARALIAADWRTHDAVRDSSVPNLGAFVAAMLFAVHPLRVESVAWVTERRDVLNGVWLALTVLFYLRAVKPPDGSRRIADWLASCVCYALSLLSKATGITLPLVLLILDVYPLHRAGRRPDGRLHGAWKRLFLEKAPFVVLAVTAGWLALRAQRHAGALWGWSEHPLSLRIAQAFYGLVFYLWKTVIPTGLIPLYEQRPDAQPFEPVFVFSAIIVLGISAAAWTLRRGWPGLAAAWAAYVVLLSPMLGLAQSGPQVVADRYSYLACLPWAILLGGWTASVWHRSAIGRGIPRIAIAAVIGIGSCVLVGLTRAQVRVWSDSYTLWTTTIQRAPDTGLAHANLAGVLLARGDAEGALLHARRALEILPGNRVAHYVVADASLTLNDFVEAEKHYRMALEISTHLGRDDPASLSGLAAAWAGQGKFPEAEEAYRRLTTGEPGEAEWPFRLASLLGQQERFAEAADLFEQAIHLNPRFGDAYYRLGIMRLKLGQPEQAMAAWNEGLARAANDVELRAKIARLLATSDDARVRDRERAVQLARSAVVESGGRSVAARQALVESLAAIGDLEQAEKEAEEMLRDKTLALGPSDRARLEDLLAKIRALRADRN